MLKKILIKIIEFYQKYLSPDHSIWVKSSDKPPYCKFTPSCSDYMKESIQKKWVIIWVVKWTRRVIRCNPWNSGWYDPVEKNNSKTPGFTKTN